MNIQEIRDSGKVLSDLIIAYNKVNKAINKIHSVKNIKVKLEDRNWLQRILWRYIKPKIVLQNKKLSHHKNLKLDILNQLSKDLYIMISRVEACETYDKNRVYILIRIVDQYT